MRHIRSTGILLELSDLEMREEMLLRQVDQTMRAYSFYGGWISALLSTALLIIPLRKIKFGLIPIAWRVGLVGVWGYYQSDIFTMGSKVAMAYNVNWALCVLANHSTPSVRNRTYRMLESISRDNKLDI